MANSVKNVSIVSSDSVESVIPKLQALSNVLHSVAQQPDGPPERSSIDLEARNRLTVILVLEYLIKKSADAEKTRGLSDLLVQKTTDLENFFRQHGD
jgi:hypothetical protein